MFAVVSKSIRAALSAGKPTPLFRHRMILG